MFICGTLHQTKCIYVYHFYKFTLFCLTFLKIVFIRYVIYKYVYILSPKLKTRGSSEIIVLDERDVWPALLLDRFVAGQALQPGGRPSSGA